MKYCAILILFFLACLQESCYYDKAELINGVSVCDTTTVVTYSNSVNPVLTANCTGCHSGVNAPNGVKLDTYDGVKVPALNGFLLGVITHSPGFSPMPKNGNKLSDCDISKIRIWINSGAPDN